VKNNTQSLLVILQNCQRYADELIVADGNLIGGAYEIGLRQCPEKDHAIRMDIKHLFSRKSAQSNIRGS
jgi:hypothetical protein